MEDDINDNVYLYDIKKKNIIKVSVDNAMFEIYFQRCRIPTENELKDNKIKMTLDEIRTKISGNESYIPLYDVFSYNIFVIQKRNVYIRIMNQNYRFPDELILNEIKNTRENKLKKIEKNDELKNDNVFMRTIRKANLMLAFMEQFNLEELYNTYLRVFYRYAPEIGNATYTCVRKSFIPHKGHLNPYYTQDEVIKLGMNMGIINLPIKMTYIDFKDKFTRKDYHDVCMQIKSNDISGNILMGHQNYIIKNEMVGLIQYYTIQGSYFMNQYMRGLTQYQYKNEYLEQNIEKIWKLILDAPAFDNDYILYRFVSTDDYLKHLKIGDTYVEKAFISTTRDPFYRTDLYKFGFVLIKIRIPKKIKGIGLCLELLSHFPSEEEIILPPLAHLKLVSVNSLCEYYHPDESFVSNVSTRYEFEWIKNGDIEFPKRPELMEETKIIDFLSIEKTKTFSVKEKIDFFSKKYFDPMNRIRCKIGDNIFYITCEWFDSTGVYKDMYALKTSDGFSLYSIYKGYILFMIEIGDVDSHSQIRVNYFTKYSQINRQEIMGDDNFLCFISSIAYYFDVPNVILYADFMSCDSMSTKQRTFSDNIDNDIDNNIDNDIDTIDYNIDRSTGGSYCIDFYKYLKYGIKRYQNTNTLYVELQPQFTYHDLDVLKNIKPTAILDRVDRDEVYQIYIQNYMIEIQNDENKNNIGDLYIWMVENKCYLMDIFINKFDGHKFTNKSFNRGIYILDAMTYLYNRRLVNTYNRFIKMEFNEEHKLLTLPKNEYRIKR